MNSFTRSTEQKIISGIRGIESDSGALIFHEQFRALRAKVEYHLDKNNYKVVAVTSSIAEEGKTTICSNLASSLASIGRKKVLLIDADLRKSDLARFMGIPRLPGMTEFLSGTVSIGKTIHKAMEGLYCIPGGERTNGASDLLAGDKFRSFLTQVRNQFDVIILDTPPVLPVADTMSLRDQIDGFLLVFRMRFTPHVMLRQMIEDMEKEKIIGIVLNHVEPLKHRYYKRYYGKYYQNISE